MDNNGSYFGSNLSSFDNDSLTAAAAASDGERQLHEAGTAAANNPVDVQINMINLIWTISFTVIVVVGTCGNGIVLWIILGE